MFSRTLICSLVILSTVTLANPFGEVDAIVPETIATQGQDTSCQVHICGCTCALDHPGDKCLEAQTLASSNPCNGVPLGLDCSKVSGGVCTKNDDYAPDNDSSPESESDDLVQDESDESDDDLVQDESDDEEDLVQKGYSFGRRRGSRRRGKKCCPAIAGLCFQCRNSPSPPARRRASPPSSKKREWQKYKGKRFRKTDMCNSGAIDKDKCCKVTNNAYSSFCEFSRDSHYCESGNKCVHPKPSRAAPGGTQYQGCYNNLGGNSMQLLFGGDYTDNLINSCKNLCAYHGHKQTYFGTSDGHHCFCGGNSAPKSYKKIADHKCNTRMPGGGGKHHTVAVYRITSWPAQPPPPPPPPGSIRVAEAWRRRSKGITCDCKGSNSCSSSKLKKVFVDRNNADKCKNLCAQNSQCRWAVYAGKHCSMFKAATRGKVRVRGAGSYGGGCWFK